MCAIEALQSCLVPWKYVAAAAEAGEQCPGCTVLDALQHSVQVNLKGVSHRRTVLKSWQHKGSVECTESIPVQGLDVCTTKPSV